MISIFSFSLLTSLHSSPIHTFTANLSNMKRKQPVCFKNNKTCYQLIRMGESCSAAYCTKSVYSDLLYLVGFSFFFFLNQNKTKQKIHCASVCFAQDHFVAHIRFCLSKELAEERTGEKKKVNFLIYTVVNYPVKQTKVDIDIRKSTTALLYSVQLLL